MGQLCCGGGKNSSSGGKKNIVIFLSSVRPYRMADRVGKYVKDRVESAGMCTTMLDPLELNFDILEIPFQSMLDQFHAPDWLQETNDKIRTADGFIIVSAEYNNTIPPALSNMLNNFASASYENRPCGIVTYSMGGFGGIRVQTLLPLMISELYMMTVPTRVAISTVQENFSEDGKCLDKKISTNIDTLIQEVEWYADAFRCQKNIKPLI